MSEKEKRELIKTLVNTKDELEMAHMNFESATRWFSRLLCISDKVHKCEI